jgi:catechol 2,3-dioxygenase-like lactoylglutathione lyase family enzyme
MIKGLYETHIFVKDLKVSIPFYRDVLGLTLCNYVEERKIAFFWVGEPQSAMLGVWEKPLHEIDIRHFAFRCGVDFVLNESVQFLKSRDLKPYNFLKTDTLEPMVFAWMPALAIYFKDPDGHELEFIAVLPGKPMPELGVISYRDWLAVQAQS